MGSHSEHRIDENSIKSFRQLDHEKRSDAIMRAYQEHGELTDRQVARMLSIEDMNLVRPMITRQLDSGTLTKCDDVVCETTERLVRVCRVAGVDDKPRDKTPTGMNNILMELSEILESVGIENDITYVKESLEGLINKYGPIKNITAETTND